MAKFAVGEKCQACRKQDGLWYDCVVTALPGKWVPDPYLYEIEVPGFSDPEKPQFGCLWLAHESRLRKLPPDDYADHIPEAMRNIFKLPQASPDAPVKRREKA